MKARFSRDGIHFFDRVTGWNILIDECIVPEERWSVAPRQLSIALTNVCDLSCPYCYAPKSRHQLELVRLKNWLLELSELECFGVGFGGGEPTLHPSFAEIVNFTATQTDLAVTFTTHGHHLDARLARQLEGSVHFIRVSVDGVGETYEAIRRKPFSDLLKRLETARSLAPFGLNMVVNARIVGDLSAVATLAETLGARELLLLPEESSMGRAGIEVDTLLLLKMWIETYRGPVPLTMSETKAASFPISRALSKEQPLESYAHINAAGELLPTSFSRYGVMLGEGTFHSALRILQVQSREEHS
ncbi:radical SAM protein [Deinococcus sp. QL22]|uniref:radical SAM protein n=1 Tax=Deinococcus sp. QL22 TaxID=2939437 RepID=UPI002017DFF6|nr:radical SAM protein [Deinococcus sp. QL22]UQN10660.1 radical SAM protein [Deinococcus sp. QL22]